MRPEQTKYLPTRAFVDFINASWGIGLTISRFRKDRMRRDDGSPGPAPEPTAHFGNRDLFTEAQASGYVATLITRAQPESEQEETA